ncbi:dihydropteroate synthase [Betaproteobacteria bacterium SCN2]|jgi:dihydropteroate synthase|nr:dihydropteroate synthase [Betaproteobacteria bacterium SCN2]
MLRCGRFTFPLDRPLIMGVVNVTPDSFSDGGRLQDARQAIDHALMLAEQGADILDVGGESTRPGAAPVSIEEELQRVLPVIEALAARGLAVSADTRKPRVMKAAIEAGAVMVNDVMALREPGAIEAVAQSDAAACLMHMQGEPQTMQAAPHYANVLAEVSGFLAQRIAACAAAGIRQNRLVIDPGFGFGKTLAHNLVLLKNLDRLAELGVPVLAGMSRKSMLGALTGKPVDQREYAGIAAHLAAVARGARIVRVHDVAAMKDALQVWEAVEGAQEE